MRDRDCGGHTAKILRNCRKRTNFAPKNASPTLCETSLCSHEVAFNNLQTVFHSVADDVEQRHRRRGTASQTHSRVLVKPRKKQE